MVTREILARRRHWLDTNPGGTVYGAIVVTASIAAISHHEDRAWVIALEAIASLVVFFLAHLHAAVVNHRFDEPTEPLGKVVKEAIAHELPMLEIAIVPVLIVAAASFRFVRTDLAVQVALFVGVFELFAIGLVRGRRKDASVLASIGMGLFYAASGGVLVGLKVAIH